MRPEVTIINPVAKHNTVLNRRTILGFAVAAGVAMAVGVPQVARAAGGAEVGIMDPGAAHKAALAGDIILIDIRRPDEWKGTNVAEGAIGLDMREENFVPTLVSLRKANPDKPIAMICRTGNRTGYVTNALAKQGFPGLVDVSEGMEGGPNGPGWLKRGLPTYDGTLENVAARRGAILP